MSATASDRFLTTREVADLTGLKPQTLALWRSAGRHPGLRYIKMGGAVRYRLTDVEAWLNSSTVGAPLEQGE